MTEKIGLVLVGIPDKEKGVFQQVVRFSKGRRFAYEIRSEPSGQADPSGTVLIVADDRPPLLAEAGESLKEWPTARLVVVSSRESSDMTAHVIKRPLLLSKILRVLDQASAQALQSRDTDERQAAPIAQATPQTQAAPRVTAESDSHPAPSPPAGPSAPKPASAPLSTPEPAPAQAGYRISVRPQPDRLREDPLRGETAFPAPEAGKPAFKALVVDDSLAIRKQLELELGQAGIDADYAQTGEEALAMANSAHFDLVFLDIVMPGIDGYEVCKRLRKTSYKKTPIIMLSGKTSPLDEVQGVLAGATTYLTKPVQHEAFQAVLTRVKTWLDDFGPGR